MEVRGGSERLSHSLLGFDGESKDSVGPTALAIHGSGSYSPV